LEEEVKTIAVGSDHAGLDMKEQLAGELRARGYGIVDCGTDSGESCDYPDFAIGVAMAVSEGRAQRGLLMCGTGAGMAMVANKVPGVRAAACNDEYSARYTRLHNDLNVLTVGARVIDVDTARRILAIFLDTTFEGRLQGGDRHLRRLAKISRVESRFARGRE
jgi:ribose 5-phosphate isomerase B